MKKYFYLLLGCTSLFLLGFLYTKNNNHVSVIAHAYADAPASGSQGANCNSSAPGDTGTNGSDGPG